MATMQLNGGYVAAGVGLRNLGYGTATISGIPLGSTVAGAYLFWDELASSSLNLAQGVFNGVNITGTAVGSDVSPCWPAPNNYGYAADVTGEVNGNGSYSLSGFASGVTNGEDPWGVGTPAPNAEGATLVVVYRNSSSPSTVIQLYGGAAETSGSVINQTLNGFGAVGSTPSAKTTFIVADGQDAPDAGATFNGNSLSGSEFQGSDPQAVATYSHGNLWDTKTYDVSSLISAGATSAAATIQGTGDCLVWVGQVLSVNGSASGAPVAAVGLGHGGSAKLNTTCSTSNPVNCASGDFWHTFTDVSVKGRGPGLDLTRTYNSLGASTNGPFGFGWTSSYNSNLVVNSDSSVTITEDDGSQVTAQPNGSGGYVMPSWADSTLTHNGDGSWSFVRQRTTTFGFSSTGKLTTITDQNGYATTLAYNGSGQLSTVTDSSGRSLTFSYGTNGLVSQVTDPLGLATTYGYDTSGQLTSVTDPLSRTTSFTYDTSGLHLLLTMTDPRSGVLTNVYDSQGRVTSQTDAAGLVTTYAYSGSPFTAAGGTTTITDPHGNPTVEQYVNGELTTLTKGTGTTQATWRYSYDPVTFGRTTATDPNGNLTRFSYDTDGNLLSETSPPTATAPTGQLTTHTYNSLDEPLTSTDPMGITMTYSYDTHGNLGTKSVQGIGGSPTATTTYNLCESSCPSGFSLGDIESVTDPAGHVTSFTYDSQGDAASVTTHPSSGVNDTTADVYDVLGRKVCEASPNATAASVNCPAPGGSRVADTTTWVYDADSEVTSLTDPLGNQTAYAYDADGNQNQVTDPLGKVTRSAFDADNRSTAVTKGYGTLIASTTSSAYDIAPTSGGTCLSSVSGVTYCTTSTDPNGAVTVDYFNALDQTIEETQPSSGTTTHTYDGVGNLLTTTTPAGTTTNAYDAVNRLTSATYSSPASGYAAAHNVTYSYDADNKRTQITDGTGTTSYSYDSLERLASTTTGAGNTTHYGYDLDNEVTSITYPNSDVVTNAYNGAGLVSSVADGLGHTTNYTYDADGNETSAALPNGDTSAQTFNNADQLTAISDAPTSSPSSPFATFGSTRNADGQVASETDTGVPSPASQSYSYDQITRLVSSTSGSYGYDAAGNPTLLTSSTSQAFNAADQLTSTSSPGTSPAPTISSVASSTTQTSATVTWTTNTAASSYVEAGAASGTYSFAAGSAAPVTSHSVTLSGLVCGATYHYVVNSANGAAASTSSDATLTTSACTSGNGITVTGATTATDWGSTQTLSDTLPTGIQANDELLATVTTAQSVTPSTPSGWTLVANQTSANSWDPR